MPRSRCTPTTSSIASRACGRSTTTTPRPMPRRSRATTSSRSTTPTGRPPLLSVFGGKITTFRKLAEHALDKLAVDLPAMPARPGPPSAALPGGDIAECRFRRPSWRRFRADYALAAADARRALRPPLRHARARRCSPAPRSADRPRPALRRPAVPARGRLPAPTRNGRMTARGHPDAAAPSTACT